MTCCLVVGFTDVSIDFFLSFSFLVAFTLCSVSVYSCACVCVHACHPPCVCMCLCVWCVFVQRGQNGAFSPLKLGLEVVELLSLGGRI